MYSIYHNLNNFWKFNSDRIKIEQLFRQKFYGAGIEQSSKLDTCFYDVLAIE